MKTLCLYYTRTNTTKAAMEHLAKLLDADIAEYTDGKDRSGALGYVGACFASMKKTFPEIQLPKDIQLDSYGFNYSHCNLLYSCRCCLLSY